LVAIVVVLFFNPFQVARYQEFHNLFSFH